MSQEKNANERIVTVIALFIAGTSLLIGALTVLLHSEKHSSSTTVSLQTNKKPR